MERLGIKLSMWAVLSSFVIGMIFGASSGLIVLVACIAWEVWNDYLYETALVGVPEVYFGV